MMGRVRTFIKGEESALDDIERALQLMSSKLYQSATVFSPPIPIMTAHAVVPESGELWRGMMIMEGVITDIFAFAETVVKNSNPNIKVSITTGAKTSYDFTLKQGYQKLSPEILVPSGARIIISIDNPSAATGVYLSCLFEPTLNSTAKSTFAIDDLVTNMQKVLDHASIG